MMLGAVCVPIFTTATAEQAGYILSDSGARILFVSSHDQLRKVLAMPEHRALEKIVIMDPYAGASIMSMQQIDAGRAPRQRDARTPMPRLMPSNPPTWRPSSTPPAPRESPRVSCSSHSNIASNLSVSLNAFDMGPPDVAISFLPLSHITARHVDFAELYRGVALAYCPFLENLARILKDRRPDIFVGVPRVFEKIYNGVQQKVGVGGLKRRLYNWALAVGTRNLPLVLAGKRPRSLSWRMANRLVFSKVSDGMGGRIRIFASGGAPLGRELAEWYAKIGIRIHEGYGLTETSPVIAVNTPSAHRLGSVGRRLSNVEVRIADDGEILVRSPSVFTGYWNMPAETEAAFENGWFKTGDIGMIDADGYLFVTDRKKDLIKTSGGKYIAPQPIESTLKSNPLVSEAAVVGERRRFPAVVIVPAFDALERWAHENHVHIRGREELVAHPRVQALYTEIVEQANESLARFERLKKVLLIAEEPSVAHGTLTPTYKLRRRRLEELYKKQIEALYAEDSAAMEPPARRQ